MLKKHRSRNYYINIIEINPAHKPLTKVVFWTDFEQIYISPKSISLKSLNYIQYSTNQKLAQIQNKRRQSNIICADFNYARAWWSTATFSRTKTVLWKYSFDFSVRLTRFQSCNSFKPLCWVTSVPHHNFSFFRRRSSISSFDRDSVFVKTSRITNCKYVKGTIGSLHFSVRCFTILQEWMDCLMCLL